MVTEESNRIPRHDATNACLLKSFAHGTLGCSLPRFHVPFGNTPVSGTTAGNKQDLRLAGLNLAKAQCACLFDRIFKGAAKRRSEWSCRQYLAS